MDIADLLNFPNPMSDNTAFFFTLQAPATRMTMQIFTVSGKKIYEAAEGNLTASYHQDRFAWDGRDFDGDEVASGVYVYRAVAYPTGQGEIAERFGKIILKR
ncbi:MAG: FlgD immunoglobulin-like domain containing protein, partial [Candidatus Zixiibacteriota bacterium]